MTIQKTGYMATEISGQKLIRLSIIIHLLLWTTLTVWVCKEILLPAVSTGPKYGISLTPIEPGSSKRKLTINDFSSHFNFVKRAWLGQTTTQSGFSIYSLENHLKVTSEWAGLKLNHAEPFAYSPTMLWVLAPLIYFPPIIAFCIFNIAGLFSIWWTTHPARCRLGSGLLAFFSPLALSCIVLGQTALLTGAGLLFIAEKTREGNRSDSWCNPILVGIVLWALTAKPPLAVTAGAMLVGLRCWRPLLVAVMLSFFSTLAITPILGPNWIHDYVHIIGSFNQINAGPAFAWSHVPSTMANLRGILTVHCGVADDVASSISSIVWFIALLCIAAAGSRPRFTNGVIWSVGVLSYLLLCPHVSGTEELQLVLLIPLLVKPGNKLVWQEAVLLVLIPLLPFASPAYGLIAVSQLVLFTVKIFLIIFIAGSMRRATLSTIPVG
jgi:Glycosyltransferase family 87